MNSLINLTNISITLGIFSALLGGLVMFIKPETKEVPIQKTKKYLLYIALFLTVGSSIIGSLIEKYFFNIKDNQQVKPTEIELYYKLDTEIENHRQITYQYLSALNSHQNIEILNFYADTLERYYLFQNIPKELILKDLIESNSIYPADFIEFEKNNININKINNVFVAYIEMKYFKTPTLEPEEILFEIRFDKERRIKYVRNFLAAKLSIKEKDNIKKQIR